MKSAAFRFLYGDMTPFEVRKFGILSLMFLNIVGCYWLLRPVKDGVFYSLVGLEYLPYAKVLSFLVIIPLIMIYTKLVDLYPRHILIYIICTTYAILFTLIDIGLRLPGTGLENTTPSPDRILGWVSYFSTESFGSITVALFWSFVASSTSSTSAKKGYALIVLGGQVGSIIGPSFATMTEFISIPNLFVIGVTQIFFVIILTRYYMSTVGFEEKIMQEQQQQIDEQNNDSAGKSHHANQKTPGIFVGLKLLLTEKYLLGIFGVSTIYEVVGTIMDYQMKVLAKYAYPSTEAYTAFLASFGVAANVLSFSIALIGTSYLLRTLGTRLCLLIYPSAIGIVLFIVFLFPDLYVLFVAQVFVKGLSYAINNPTKEMLYLPTSPDVKFKVKSWIDMFGGSSSLSFFISFILIIFLILIYLY